MIVVPYECLVVRVAQQQLFFHTGFNLDCLPP